MVLFGAIAHFLAQYCAYYYCHYHHHHFWLASLGVHSDTRPESGWF